MISTNDLVPAGASFHASAGDGFCWPASHVNFDGMLPPSVNAGLEIENTPAAIRTPIMCALLEKSSVPDCSRAFRRSSGDNWLRSCFPLKPADDERSLFAVPTGGHMEIDRRAFIASLGGPAAV